MAVDPLERVDDPGLRAVADGTAADEVRGQRPLERLADGAAGRPVNQARHPPYRIVRDRDPGGIRLAVALTGCEPAPTGQPAAARVRGDGVVQRLHDERDDRALAPMTEIVEPGQVTTLTPHLAEPDPPAGRALLLVGQDRLEEAHRVAPLAVSHRLDVRLRVGVERRGDGDATAEIDRGVARDGAEDRLGVGAREVSEPARQVREGALVAHPVQEALGPQGGGGEDDLLRSQHA